MKELNYSDNILLNEGEGCKTVPLRDSFSTIAISNNGSINILTVGVAGKIEDGIKLKDAEANRTDYKGENIDIEVKSQKFIEGNFKSRQISIHNNSDTECIVEIL